MIKAVIASTGLKGLATLAAIEHGAAVDGLPTAALQRSLPLGADRLATGCEPVPAIQVPVGSGSDRLV